ncbi:hypothetical protein B9Z55_010004 [Caenorhabditis nigoni]|uniref:Uncharacterized protein n=1 Tax=Caenorhabditis nigoni TaxID=1611254 RepID=A0A2G5UEY2_9PELO|nr:hypothetical protein B9Z55_010004 [Caenorhabditis nigoni]
MFTSKNYGCNRIKVHLRNEKLTEKSDKIWIDTKLRHTETSNRIVKDIGFSLPLFLFLQSNPSFSSLFFIIQLPVIVMFSTTKNETDCN